MYIVSASLSSQYSPLTLRTDQGQLWASGEVGKSQKCYHLIRIPLLAAQEGCWFPDSVQAVGDGFLSQRAFLNSLSVISCLSEWHSRHRVWLSMTAENGRWGLVPNIGDNKDVLLGPVLG